MAFFERLGARVIIGTGEKVIRRMARDIKMKKKGRAEGYAAAVRDFKRTGKFKPVNQR